MWRNGNIQVQLLPVLLSYLRSAIGLLNNKRYLQLKESQDSDAMSHFDAMKVKVLVIQSCLIFETPWTVSHQVLSMEFFRQEYCLSSLLFPSPGNLPNPVIEPGSPSLQADSLPSETPGKPIKSPRKHKDARVNKN